MTYEASGSTLAHMKRRQRRRAQSGQVMVETVIVLSVLVFLILGALQIMMLQHGRIMTEYAAYNACRAGIVHNGDWNVMQNAAMIGALPIYNRTDTPLRFLEAWAKVKAVSEATQAVDMSMGTLERLAGDLIGVEISGIAQDISLIEVHVTSPTAAAFREADRWQQNQVAQSTEIDPHGVLKYPDNATEIDFDDVEFFKSLHTEHPGEGRLGVDVRVLYPLRIPVVNKIIFELWLAQLELGTRRIESDITEWAQMRGRTVGGRRSGMYLDEAVADVGDEGPLDDFFTTPQWRREVRTLRWVADRYGVYLIPLHATYAMQMQSNMYEGNRREPVWFTIEEL
ncbi:TadE/TadG family type IV pilus assembly protein [Myxococcota bacterium]